MKHKKLLVAAMATVTALVGALSFAACGDDNDDKKEEIPLTSQTDFSALVSEKVDENGWKKAFALKDYDVNFSNDMTVVGKHKEERYKDESYTVKYNINELFYKGTLNEDGDTLVFEASIKKDKDETISYYYYDYNESEGLIQKTPKKDDNTDTYKEMNDLYNFYHAMYCPDFSAQFSKFTYDETKHSYICNDTVVGTGLFEGSSDGVPGQEDYKNVEVKIINGRLAYLTCGNSENGYTLISKFYDFGKTAITYKDVEEVTEMP